MLFTSRSQTLTKAAFTEKRLFAVKSPPGESTHIMVLSRICALLCLGCLLAGCGTTRPVVVVEKDEFMKMAHNMPKELQARDLLDKDGSYTAPMSFKGLKDYGDILFTRLSPSFMLQNDTAHDVYLGETFSATISVSPTVSASIMPRRSLKSIWSALRTGTGTDRMNG